MPDISILYSQLNYHGYVRFHLISFLNESISNPGLIPEELIEKCKNDLEMTEIVITQTTNLINEK